MRTTWKLSLFGNTWIEGKWKMKLQIIQKTKKWRFFFIGKLMGGRKGYPRGKFFTLSNFIYKWKECNACVCFSLSIASDPYHTLLSTLFPCLSPLYSLGPQAFLCFTEQLLPWKTDLYLPSEGRNEDTLSLCVLHILQEGESQGCKGQDVRLRLCTSTDHCAVPPSSPRLTHLTPKSFVSIPGWRGSAGNGKLFPGR